MRNVDGGEIEIESGPQIRLQSWRRGVIVEDELEVETAAAAAACAFDAAADHTVYIPCLISVSVPLGVAELRPVDMDSLSRTNMGSECETTRRRRRKRRKTASMKTGLRKLETDHSKMDNGSEDEGDARAVDKDYMEQSQDNSRCLDEARRSDIRYRWRCMAVVRMAMAMMVRMMAMSMLL